MRIAITNWSQRKVGGVETYLSAIVPALAHSGHEVAFWCEVDEPTDRASIILADGMSSWCVKEIGAEQALEGLRAWQPDVIYAHKYADANLESEVQHIAPAVFFAHDYYGTCISGSKTFKYPVVTPCQRRFGAACLLHYFPHGCGGRSPLTMLKLYRLQTRRLKLLHGYDAIATHSEHMRNELVRHGLDAQCVHSFPYYVNSVTSPQQSAASVQEQNVANGNPAEVPAPSLKPEHWHLLFSGRMEFLKGGHVFLAALPEVVAMLDRPVHVTFAGDGRERQKLERMSTELKQKHPGLNIEFTGWLNQERMKILLSQSDLLVVPSLWPEPFGLVGPEAGLHGVPVAAFAVGGVGDWLTEGLNGALAPGIPPTPAGLAAAILRCLQNPAEHAQLRQGAIKIAQQFNVKDHLQSLMAVFEKAIEHRRCKTVNTETVGLPQWRSSQTQKAKR